MQLEFFKYHGAGNDFVLVDARNSGDELFNEALVNRLCDRHFGIGSDGLILLLKDSSSDFRMKYFNSDGKEGSMCGNGGRCITAFARDLGIIALEASFAGIDGIHHARILNDGTISLRMKDVDSVQKLEDGYFLDTGSAHFVSFHNSIDKLEVFKIGQEIRHQSRFGEDGCNVNFIETTSESSFKIRTFERGVENETLACGTGSVASAIASGIRQKSDINSYDIEALGGKLRVKFNPKASGGYTDIYLEGPAEFVFKGVIEI